MFLLQIANCREHQMTKYFYFIFRDPNCCQSTSERARLRSAEHSRELKQQSPVFFSSTNLTVWHQGKRNIIWNNKNKNVFSKKLSLNNQGILTEVCVKTVKIQQILVLASDLKCCYYFLFIIIKPFRSLCNYKPWRNRTISNCFLPKYYTHIPN